MKTVLIAVLSLDGRLTLPEQPGPGFASPEDQAWFHGALRGFTCAVIGRATFETIRDEIRVSTRRDYLRMVMTRTPQKFAGEIVPDSLEFTAESPATILRELAARGHTQCALLGGGQIYQAFLDAGLVDAMWLTLEPIVLGGGTPFVDGGLVRDGRFRLAETRQLTPDTLLLNYEKPGTTRIPLPTV